MLDVVIPYKSEINQGELKFALRSIEKNLSGYDNIFIVGHKPKWIQNVIHIPAKDYPGRKAFSIMQKTLLACNDERLSENFIFTNDDIYFLKPIHVNDIKYWYEGTLEDWLKKTPSAKYKVQIKNTINTIMAQSAYMDIHAPIIYDKQFFKDLMWPFQSEFLVKSLYYELVGGEIEPMTDLKLNGHIPADRIRKLIRDRLFFSSSQFTNQVERVLTELYPNKSRYEN